MKHKLASTKFAIGDRAAVYELPAWKSLNETERKTLIRHEIGHCSLFMKHEACGTMRPEL